MRWNMADVFESVVAVIPDREVLVIPDAPGGRRVFTLGQLDERINRLANALAERGVGPGDKVGVYGYNGNEWVEAQWAAWKLRAVPINVNYRYVEAELRYLFDNADLAAIVHSAQFAPAIAAVKDGCPKLKGLLAFDDGSGQDISVSGSEDYEAVLAASSPLGNFEERSNDDLYMLYTGGTTGMPKGVMWRHEDFFLSTLGPIMSVLAPPLERAEEVAERAPGANPMVSLPLAPLMHGAAQWTSIANMLSGNRMVLLTQPRMDTDAIWRAVGDEGVQVINIVGDAQARPLIEALERLGDDVDPSSLFVVGSGGAILSPAVKAKFAQVLPNTIVMDVMGASETGFQGSTSGADDSGRPQFSFNDHTIVIDDEGNPVVPGDGVVGRLARRGYIPLGYYKDEEKTAATFPTINGQRWVVPGDMATVEADGTITLLGRGSVSINSGGEKIFPEEVELALKGHPEVYDAVVVGVPDERFGQRVAAVVQPRGEARPTAEDLAEHCRALIAGYKVPREVHYVDEMVRSPSGKADYRWATGVATGA